MIEVEESFNRRGVAVMEATLSVSSPDEYLGSSILLRFEDQMDRKLDVIMSKDAARELAARLQVFAK